MILALDKAGTPFKWASVEEGISWVAKGLVVWDLGDTEMTLRGGISGLTGERSSLSVKSIIAINGLVGHDKFIPALSRRALFTRDRHICAYCGDSFQSSFLTMDHIVAKSKGGPNSWTNLVTACKGCNHRKGDMSLDEAGLKLLYVPYTPNRHEAFILSNRNILADQMDFLKAGLPRNSRLL